MFRCGYFELLSVFISLCVPFATSKKCITNDACSCTFDDGSGSVIINSVGNSDKTPKFMDKPSADGNQYSFNPCYPFNEGDCNGVAACIKTQFGQTMEIADPTSAEFVIKNGVLSVQYTAGSTILLTTDVVLKCDPNACTPTMVADGSKGINRYQLALTTICACPGKCSKDGAAKCISSSGVASLGIGTILVIILFSVMFVYLIGGVLYLKFIRKAEGADVIPNKGFWAALPGLAASGFFCIVNSIRRKNGYERK